MSETSKPKRANITLIASDAEERDRFHKAAKAEGFSTMAAWGMYHLRNQAKQTLAEEKE